MPRYEWINPATGEIVELNVPVEEAGTPPAKPGNWERIWSPPAIGRVPGAGNSPARPSGRSS